MAGTLAILPPELLFQIIAHIDTARALSHLSRTCRRIHNFVEQDGFRIFVQNRFRYFQPPSVYSSSFWRDAAHGLTTLSRNWDRKAFLAWNGYPRAEDSQDHRRQRAYFRSGQTMGFAPVIDSYETWHGGDWSSRKEVVAWGAGAGVIMRVKSMGDTAKDMRRTRADQHPTDLNVHLHTIHWAKYLEKGAVEGRDDITSLDLQPQPHLDGPEQMIVGRASGSLSLLSLLKDSRGGLAEIVVEFYTGGRIVRSATTSSGSHPLLAACLSDSAIALYPLNSAHAKVSPVGESLTFPAGHPGRTWSSRFLSHDRLAVGFGPAKEPIRIYDLGRGELRDENSRSLALFDADAGTSLDMPQTKPSGATSVYSMAKIPSSSTSGRAEGDLFLSGAYDGLTR